MTKIRLRRQTKAVKPPENAAPCQFDRPLMKLLSASHRVISMSVKQMSRRTGSVGMNVIYPAGGAAPCEGTRGEMVPH